MLIIGTYAAVIFDLDGTLLDTERLIIDAAEAVLNRRGHDVTRNFVTGLVGIDDAEGLRRLSAHIGPAFEAATFDAEWGREAQKLYAAGIPLRPGVAALLEALAAAGLPHAVATNSRTESALRKLRMGGLSGQFRADHVVGFDAAGVPKPAPDVFLEAARRLDVDPETCLAFEDTETGVTAALAAGMTVAQIPDMTPATSRRAHVLADDILAGARAAGLIAG